MDISLLSLSWIYIAVASIYWVVIMTQGKHFVLAFIESLFWPFAILYSILKTDKRTINSTAQDSVAKDIKEDNEEVVINTELNEYDDKIYEGVKKEKIAMKKFRDYQKQRELAGKAEGVWGDFKYDAETILKKYSEKLSRVLISLAYPSYVSTPQKRDLIFEKLFYETEIFLFVIFERTAQKSKNPPEIVNIVKGNMRREYISLLSLQNKVLEPSKDTFTKRMDLYKHYLTLETLSQNIEILEDCVIQFTLFLAYILEKGELFTDVKNKTEIIQNPHTIKIVHRFVLKFIAENMDNFIIEIRGICQYYGMGV